MLLSRTLIFAVGLIVISLDLLTAQELQPVGYGPYLKASGSFGVSLGYRPGLAFGGGFDHRFARALLLVDAAYDTADKVDASGSSVKAGAGLYFTPRQYGVGGGARCVRLTTSVYDKAFCRPFFGGVVDLRSFRLQADYLLPGSDNINRLQGVRTMAVFPFTRHVQFELETAVYRFTASQGSRRYTGFVANPGIRYRF